MRVLAIASVLALAGCNPFKDHAPYTLYRNSPLDLNDRVHWASFDTDERGTYNQENCSIAAGLLNENLRRINGPEVKVRFWCEKGAYRP